MSPARTSPRPRDRRRTDTRERIVRAAVGLFADGGYSATSVADIERAVGLSPGAGGLYRHFRSKDELLLAAVEAYRDRVRVLREELAGRWSAPTPRPTRSRTSGRSGASGPAPDGAAADLRHLLEALLTLLGTEIGVVRLSLEGPRLPDDVRAVLGEAWDHAYAAVGSLFEHHGMSPDRARASAVLALGSLHHYAEQMAGWGRVPGGVPAGALVDRWVEQWSELLTDRC